MTTIYFSKDEIDELINVIEQFEFGPEDEDISNIYLKVLTKKEMLEKKEKNSEAIRKLTKLQKQIDEIKQDLDD